MSAKCVLQKFPCQNPDYTIFDNIASRELENPIPATSLISSSAFCTMLPTDEDHLIGDITHKTFLKALRGQSGIYHLWIDHDNCDDHENYTMLCVYVGKGMAQSRIKYHIQNIWPEGIQLYVTFTKLENRMSKYYEQLFLDIYSFAINSKENSGKEKLYAVWDEETHNLGTQLHDVSNQSKTFGLGDL